MVQGYHGTGKSTHIEQVAARLHWPLIRVNLDSHVSRIDLVGKDAIVLKDGKQITEFREGMLPWAIQRPIALVFDEYDAGALAAQADGHRIVSLERVEQKWIHFCARNPLLLLNSRSRFSGQAIPPDPIVT